MGLAPLGRSITELPFMRFPSVLTPSAAALLLGLALVSLAHDASAAKPTAKEAKVNIYVEMLNSESKYIFDNRATYAKWVDMKAGPTCHERGLRQPGSVGDSAPDRYAHY